MKKVLAIFMAVLFGVSLTAVAASADIGEHRDHGNHRDVGRGEHGNCGWATTIRPLVTWPVLPKL